MAEPDMLPSPATRITIAATQIDRDEGSTTIQ
jgi:hypothetical protein